MSWFDDNPAPDGGGGLGLQGQQSQIQQWYQQYLGRSASQEEINSHLGNPGGLSAVESLIKGSQEAAQRNTPAPTATPTQTATATYGPGPTAAPKSGNLTQAIDYVQQQTGKTLTDADVTMLLQKFGGNAQSSFTEAGLAPVVAFLKGGGATGPGGPGGPDPYGGTDGRPPDIYHSDPNAPPPPNDPTKLAPYVAPTWQGGGAPTASALTPFHAPTLEELQASPGYQARMAMGQQALERSAAAKGTVLGGGQQKALARYGQEYASNEYGNLFGQSLTTNQVNNASTQTGSENAYKTYMANYGQFQDAANLSLGARQQNVGENNTAFNQGQTNYQNRYAQYLDKNSRTLNDYLTNVTTRRNANNDYWQHLNDLNQTGANTANNSYKYTSFQ